MTSQIKATDCARLEQDKAFKLKYLKTIWWWKSFHIVPPTLLLFLGLFGLLYLLSYEILISYYAIPFFIIFMIGTIWFKSVKRYLQNALISNTEGNKVCVACPVCEKQGYTCFAFVNEEKRHNEHFIRQFTLSLSADDLASKVEECKKRPVFQHDESSDTKYILISFLTRNIEKQNALWKEGDTLPLLFIDKDNVRIIKGADIKQ